MRQTSALDLTGYVLLLASFVAGSVVASVIGFLLLFHYDSCGSRGVGACDARSAVLAVFLTPAVSVGGLLFSVVGAVRRARHHRSIWWLPLVSLGSVIVAIVVASALAYSG